MGFLGILEDHKLPHVPATVILNEEKAENVDATIGLKHGTGRNSHIVLVPQPSEDPNDPLNWSSTKKLTIILVIGLGSTLYASVLAPLLSPALVTISIALGKPIGSITEISGYMLLVTGASGPFVSACSRKWGKRPLLLISSMFGLLGSIIGSATNSYSGLLGGRIIQGASISAFESLVISMIGDLFFVHQRGIYMTVMQFILGAASNFSAVIVGPITEHLGWKYLFHLLIAFTAFETILLFFFVPETSYNRDHRYDIDELADTDLKGLAAAEERHMMQGKGGASDLEKIQTTTSNRPTSQKKTYIQELAIFTGTYSNDNLLQLLIAPFAVLLNLAVLWVVLISGTLTALFVAQSYVLAQIFQYPPYNLSASGVGYLSLGPFLGGMLAAIFLGLSLDPMIKWAAKKNNGVYEPEYRLLAMIPSLLTGVGLFAFGYLCQKQASFYATATMHGMDLFGIVCATISTSAYAIDAFRDMSSEIFIIAMVYKNFLFYGFSYFVNNWTATAGPATVFYVFGGLGFALSLSTPIVFIWGKKYRSFWHRHNLLEKMHIKTHSEF